MPIGWKGLLSFWGRPALCSPFLGSALFCVPSSVHSHCLCPCLYPARLRTLVALSSSNSKQPAVPWGSASQAEWPTSYLRVSWKGSFGFGGSAYLSHVCFSVSNALTREGLRVSLPENWQILGDGKGLGCKWVSPGDRDSHSPKATSFMGPESMALGCCPVCE